jgi:hypothetical protein
MTVLKAKFKLLRYPSGPLLLSIELHAPTSFKLIGKGGQFTYTPTLPLTCRLPQAAYVEYWSGL